MCRYARNDHPLFCSTHQPLVHYYSIPARIPSAYVLAYKPLPSPNQSAENDGNDRIGHGSCSIHSSHHFVLKEKNNPLVQPTILVTIFDLPLVPA